MTPDEAYAVLGVCDPIKHSRTWAENIWGVDGLPLSVAQRLIRQEAGTLARRLIEHGGAPLVDDYVLLFTTAAKARLFDLYMSQYLGGAA